MSGNIGTFFLNNFNSRPSARGDDKARLLEALGKFQFTPLREGRPLRWACLPYTTIIFQFTPLREGRPHARAYNLM